jgi:hypothetical protein
MTLSWRINDDKKKPAAAVGIHRWPHAASIAIKRITSYVFTISARFSATAY